MKASVFRRWPVTAPYRGEQTTRLTGGHDFYVPVSVYMSKSYFHRIHYAVYSISDPRERVFKGYVKQQSACGRILGKVKWYAL